MITIIIEGPEKAGKSHAIALIGKHLKSLGCNVTIQSEKTHNAGEMAEREDELLECLRNTPIVIQEMRTAAQLHPHQA